MLTHPDVAGQLAREHGRQLRADASQRQRRHQLGQREAGNANAEAVSGTPSATVLVTRSRNGDKQAWDELFGICPADLVNLPQTPATPGGCRRCSGRPSGSSS